MSIGTLDQHDLAQFTGTENWYRHGLMPRLIYTDGVKYVAETAGAYWLIDLVASWQPTIGKCERPEFQNWNLVRGAGSAATITCDDGDGNIMAQQEIEYTDFPLAEFGFYCVDDDEHLVMMLKSEY
jgi:hypothetical protein